MTSVIGNHAKCNLQGFRLWTKVLEDLFISIELGLRYSVRLYRKWASGGFMPVFNAMTDHSGWIGTSFLLSKRNVYFNKSTSALQREVVWFSNCRNIPDFATHALFDSRIHVTKCGLVAAPLFVKAEHVLSQAPKKRNNGDKQTDHVEMLWYAPNTK